MARTQMTWRRQVRIIRSLPPVDRFEAIDAPDDRPLLIAAEQKTDPRVMETTGKLDFVPPERGVGGVGAACLIAPFTHVSPDRNWSEYYREQTTG
ncbi:MAG TPA: hypothetical protein VHO91_21260 [Rhodopila sp.]|nr:hypothetical protein [Rhodopila sp.]